MRIFASGDFHNQEKVKKAILKELKKEKYELFLGLGDYTKKKYFKELRDKPEPQKVFLTGNWDFNNKTPGNNEIPSLFNYVKVNFKAKDKDYKLVMLGATFPSNFKKDIIDWVGDFDRNRLIFCSHYPPYMTKDLTQFGTHAGVPEFRDLIIKLKPALWLCGHIHEDSGVQKFLKTKIVNVSACDVKYKSARAGYSININEKGVQDIKEVKL